MENLKNRANRLIREAYPDFDPEIKKLGELPWGSLEWATFLSNLLALESEESQQKLIRKIFISHQIDSLNWESFLKILDD